MLFVALLDGAQAGLQRSQRPEDEQVRRIQQRDAGGDGQTEAEAAA